jgi:hypothetical protein
MRGDYILWFHTHSALDGFLQFTVDTATLLGAPPSTGQAMTECFTARCNDLCRAVERLKLIAHDALVLLKNSLSTPKLQYTLRAACCEGHNLLTTFDNMSRSALCNICNVTLTDQQLLQASLLVRAGGLGIRRVSSLAPSAFLPSAAGTRDLQDLILRRTERTADDVFDRCLVSQLGKFAMLPPSGSVAGKQQAWDKAVVEAEFNILVNCCTNAIIKSDF